MLNHSTPPARPDPLAHPKAVRIPLDAEQSECLLEHGETFLVIARQTYPGNPARLQLLGLPVSLEVAKAAESVALGKARAATIRKVDTAPQPTVTAP
jgi:hypothetical protein